jgi:ankyrin repeat protein
MSLTAEEKSAKMSTERAFLTKFLESALMGDASTLQTCVTDYLRQHIDVSPLEVLTQFKDGQKRTALHFACQSMSTPGEIDIVQAILKDEWLPNAEARQIILQQKDQDGLTPIMLAAQHPDPQMAQKRVLLILDKADGVKLGLARSHTGATALHYAAGAGGTPETIRALYEAGHAALTTFSRQGGTPLHWAAAAGRDFSATMDQLISCGADVNAQDDSIPFPLVLAVAAGNDKHSKRLLQSPDISIDTKLPGNVTLFHMAADLNLVGTLALLLEKQQDKEILFQKNHDGLTALDLAAQEGHVGCVLLLLPETDGKTPTEDDAKAFTEDYKQTNGKKETTAPPETQEKPKDESPTTDATEDEAQRKAALVAASDDVSEADVQKAVDCKAQGNAHFVKKEWKQAHVFYSQAIEANPKEAAFYSNRSACNMMMQQPKAALQDAVMARTLKPNWSKACYRMAVARLELDRYEDAALAAWEGLQQDQENEELKSLLQKCVKKGRKDFQQAKGGDGAGTGER